MLHAHEAIAEEASPQPAVAEAVVSAGGPVVTTQLTPATVLALQRSAGNAAVVRILRQADGLPQDVPPAPASGTAEGPQATDGEEVTLAPITIPAQDPIPVEFFAAGPRLEGKTTASYSSTDPAVAPNPPKASRAPGGGIRAQGTVSSTFSSNPDVAMPDIDGRGFTDCQHKNAEKFLANVLGPHEQLHVSAFKTNFDGKWTKPFDLTVKDADDATGQIKVIYDTEFAARKKKADDASHDLDTGGKNNFTWDMDEGCTDKPDK